jgi:hypothetical protein
MQTLQFWFRACGNAKRQERTSILGSASYPLMPAKLRGDADVPRLFMAFIRHATFWKDFLHSLFELECKP